MSANDYFNDHPQQPPQQPYQSYNSNPSVQSQAGSLHPLQRPAPSPTSPFETPFDDHVYPTGNSNSYRMDSQSTLGPDTRYYGKQGGRPQDSQDSFADNIPLQDHPGKPGMSNESTDHVYDAPAAPPHMMEEGMNKGRTGGLGMPKKRIAWVVYTLTLVQVGVFIGEIVKNATLTSSPIEIHPSFNPMIGPSPWVLINMGARYVPCMHNITEVPDITAVSWGCPNSTSNDVAVCTLSQLCGFGGFKSVAVPDQWFRFITPIFLHAGVIHIGFNMLLQMTLGREMELAIGPIRFFLVYFCSGIFGFVLGGNFAATGIASTGASGALFGIMALTLLDLLYTWKERQSPWKDLAFIALDVVVSFVLGLLPGLDNFSHIGGFFMGIVLGICILRSPNALRKRINQDEPPYAPMKHSNGDDPDAGVTGFFKNPVSFFKGRKPAWWAWWLIRAASLAAVFIIFILLLNNFYFYRKTCSWCKYLSCINVNNWCEIGKIQLTNVDTNTTKKRSLLDSWDAMAKLYEASI